MSRYTQVLEILADLEHQQWEHWSRTLASELLTIRNALRSGEHKKAERIIKDRLKRWKKNWKPYRRLPEDEKESDRKWAEKVLDHVPVKCPVWQCGGWMMTVERNPPKGTNQNDPHYDGDFQTPDLVCVNCKARYMFDGFKKRRS